MNKVKPIKKIEDIEKIKKVLKSKNARDYFLFTFGINTGFKLSELLNLKFNDFNIKKKKVCINEVEHHLNPYLIECFSEFKYEILKNMSITSDTFVFKGRKGEAPIDRSHAYRILNTAAKEAGLEMKVGAHTMRKTFGYHHYEKYRDIKYLKNFYNHSSSERTKNYIGVNISETCKKRDMKL